MAQYGLGNFLYELSVENGNATFKFWDPDDPTNHTDVTVAAKDFPEGIQDADARQVADYAFSQVSKEMNEHRDERLANEATDALAQKQEEDARQRDEAADFFDHSQDLADTTPTGKPGEGPGEDKPAPAHKAQSQDSIPDDSKKSSNDSNDKKKK